MPFDAGQGLIFRGALNKQFPSSQQERHSRLIVFTSNNGHRTDNHHPPQSPTPYANKCNPSRSDKNVAVSCPRTLLPVVSSGGE